MLYSIRKSSIRLWLIWAWRGFSDTAGASPNQANPDHIVDLDMVGTGYAVDAFGEVMAAGGAGLIISSQAAYMYPIPNNVEVQQPSA